MVPEQRPENIPPATFFTLLIKENYNTLLLECIKPIKAEGVKPPLELYKLQRPIPPWQ